MIAVAGCGGSGGSSQTTTTPTKTFTADAGPIFVSSGCTVCHSPTGSYSAYNLTTYAGTLADVVAGNATQSKLIQKISSGGSMATYISSADVNTLTTWVNQGATQ